MRLTRLGCAAMLLACAVATGTDASARTKKISTGPSYPVTRMSHTAPPGYDLLAPACKLGIFGDPPPSGSTQNVLDFNPVDGDYFYTWLKLDSLSCNNSCGFGTYGHLSAAHVGLFFPAAPETLIMSVGIVGVVQSSCRFQDPGVVFCPSFDQTLTWQNPIEANDFTIPIPNECRLEISGVGNGQAFLEYNFKYSKFMSPNERPQVVVQSLPVRCTTYVPIVFPQEDWYDNYDGGNPIMYVDVEKCLHVPTRRASWGQLKQLYR